jgi:conjugative transfer signal peptidase TraF
LIRIAVAIAAAGICLVVVLGCVGVRLNLSSSLPVGLYLKSADSRTPLVEFCPEEPAATLAIVRGYRSPGNCPDGATPLLKPIVAVAGDVVEVSALGLTVNHTLLSNTKPRLSDAHGRRMNPWPLGTYRVVPGTVWVVSSFNSQSFDSRYFGPLQTSSIRHHMRPLLTE